MKFKNCKLTETLNLKIHEGWKPGEQPATVYTQRANQGSGDEWEERNTAELNHRRRAEAKLK